MDSFFSFIIIGTVIAVVFYLGSKQHEQTAKLWTPFAKAHKLKLNVKSFSVQVVGKYKDKHDLKLYIISKDKKTYTRLTMRRNKEISKKQVAFDKGMLATEIDTFIKKNLTFKGISKLKGSFACTDRGRFVSYEELDIIKTSNVLTQVSNILSDTATHYLSIVSLGGEAIPTLLAMAKKQKHPLHKIIKQLVRDIGIMTKQQIAPQGSWLTCPECFTCCGEHKAPLGFWSSITYYGCRTCGQSRKFISTPIVALLDSEMTTQTLATDDEFYINWLIKRELFDFDCVEIKQATDEDIERFAVQVGNDTDPTRKKLYKKMECIIHPTHQLSKNASRILERIFGSIEQLTD